MNKTAKYTIIALVIAVVIYIAYRFFKNPKPVSEVVKQPVQSTGNAKAVVASPSSGSGAAIIDIKSGGLSVSNLQNGIAPDPVTTSSTPNLPVVQPIIKNDPKLGPVILDNTTSQPKVSDLTNGLSPDQPILDKGPIIPA